MAAAPSPPAMAATATFCAPADPAASLFSVAGLVAVITGGGTGLGRTMAHTLAAHGAARVYVVGRRLECLQETAAAYSDTIVPLVGDVTSQTDLARVAAAVREQSGHMHLLIANAGTPGPGLSGLNARPTVSDFVRKAWASPMTDFDAVYALNCSAVYYTILAFLELLDAGNTTAPRPGVKSQVIVTSSMVAFQRDPRYGFAYCSSKAAVVSLVKCFATFAVHWGIRFNAIALGRESPCS